MPSTSNFSKKTSPANASLPTWLAWMVNPVGLGQAALLVYLPVLVNLTPLTYADWAGALAIGMAMYLLGTLCWPRLLGVWGHRHAIRLGLIGFILSMAILSLTIFAWQLGWLNRFGCIAGVILSRVIYGMFASALLPSVQSWTLALSNSGLSTSQHRVQAFSGISLQLALGRALGPVATFVGQWFYPLLPLFFLVVWPIVLLSFFLVKSTQVVDVSPEIIRGGAVFRNVKMMGRFGVIALIATAIASSVQLVVGPVLENILQATPTVVSQAMAALMIVVAIITMLAHDLQRRYPPTVIQQRIVWLSALLACCSAALFSADDPLFFSIVIIVMSLALAWLTPLYSAVIAERATNTAMVTAQLGITHILGHVLGLSAAAFFMGVALSAIFGWLLFLSVMLTVCLSRGVVIGLWEGRSA